MNPPGDAAGAAGVDVEAIRELLQGQDAAAVDAFVKAVLADVQDCADWLAGVSTRPTRKQARQRLARMIALAEELRAEVGAWRGGEVRLVGEARLPTLGNCRELAAAESALAALQEVATDAHARSGRGGRTRDNSKALLLDSLYTRCAELLGPGAASSGDNSLYVQVLTAGQVLEAAGFDTANMDLPREIRRARRHYKPSRRVTREAAEAIRREFESTRLAVEAIRREFDELAKRDAGGRQEPPS